MRKRRLLAILVTVSMVLSLFTMFTSASDAVRDTVTREWGYVNEYEYEIDVKVDFGGNVAFAVGDKVNLSAVDADSFVAEKADSSPKAFTVSGAKISGNNRTQEIATDSFGWEVFTVVGTANDRITAGSRSSLTFTLVGKFEADLYNGTYEVDDIQIVDDFFAQLVLGESPEEEEIDFVYAEDDDGIDEIIFVTDVRATATKVALEDVVDNGSDFIGNSDLGLYGDYGDGIFTLKMKGIEWDEAPFIFGADAVVLDLDFVGRNLGNSGNSDPNYDLLVWTDIFELANADDNGDFDIEEFIDEVVRVRIPKPANANANLGTLSAELPVDYLYCESDDDGYEQVEEIYFAVVNRVAKKDDTWATVVIEDVLGEDTPDSAENQLFGATLTIEGEYLLIGVPEGEGEVTRSYGYVNEYEYEIDVKIDFGGEVFFAVSDAVELDGGFNAAVAEELATLEATMAVETAAYDAASASEETVTSVMTSASTDESSARTAATSASNAAADASASLVSESVAGNNTSAFSSAYASALVDVASAEAAVASASSAYSSASVASDSLDVAMTSASTAYDNASSSASSIEDEADRVFVVAADEDENEFELTVSAVRISGNSRMQPADNTDQLGSADAREKGFEWDVASAVGTRNDRLTAGNRSYLTFTLIGNFDLDLYNDGFDVDSIKIAEGFLATIIFDEDSSETPFKYNKNVNGIDDIISVSAVRKTGEKVALDDVVLSKASNTNNAGAFDLTDGVTTLELGRILFNEAPFIFGAESIVLDLEFTERNLKNFNTGDDNYDLLVWTDLFEDENTEEGDTFDVMDFLGDVVRFRIPRPSNANTNLGVLSVELPAEFFSNADFKRASKIYFAVINRVVGENDTFVDVVIEDVVDGTDNALWGASLTIEGEAIRPTVPVKENYVIDDISEKIGEDGKVDLAELIAEIGANYDKVILSEEGLLALEEDLTVVVAEGIEYTILVDSIDEDAIAEGFVLNFSVVSENYAIEGYSFAEGSLVILPGEVGEFGLDIELFVSAELLGELDAADINLYYVSGATVSLIKDGVEVVVEACEEAEEDEEHDCEEEECELAVLGVKVVLSKASFYVLADAAPQVEGDVTDTTTSDTETEPTETEPTETETSATETETSGTDTSVSTTSGTSGSNDVNTSDTSDTSDTSGTATSVSESDTEATSETSEIIEEGYKVGDVNGDEQITIADALEILKYLAKMTSTLDTEEGLEAGRILGATVPGIGDVLEILKYLAKMNNALVDNHDWAPRA